jgi:hypothetical protein
VTTGGAFLRSSRVSRAGSGRGQSRLVQTLLVLPPLLAAMAAMPLLLMWIMGASALAGTADEAIFGFGLSALILYPSAYVALITLQGLSAWLKWPLVNLFHSLIWLCLAALIGTMSYVLMVLDPFRA